MKKRVQSVYFHCLQLNEKDQRGHRDHKVLKLVRTAGSCSVRKTEQEMNVIISRSFETVLCCVTRFLENLSLVHVAGASFIVHTSYEIAFFSVDRTQILDPGSCLLCFWWSFWCKVLHLDDSMLSHIFDVLRLLLRYHLIFSCETFGFRFLPLREKKNKIRGTWSKGTWSALCVSSCLKLLDVEVVLQKVWVCRLSEWEHQCGGGEGGREGGAGRGVMHVCCVDSRACAEWGFTGCGPERSRYGVWVTRPIDSSAAESGGAAEKCHSHYRRHSPDSSSNRSAGRRSLATTAIWNTSSTLIFLHLLRYIRIYTVRLLFTCHSSWGWLIRKKSTIYSYVGRAESTVWSGLVRASCHFFMLL